MGLDTSRVVIVMTKELFLWLLLRISTRKIRIRNKPTLPTKRMTVMLKLRKLANLNMPKMLSEILNLIQDQTDQDPQSEDPDQDQAQDRGPGQDRVRDRGRLLQPDRLDQGVVLQVVAVGGLEVAVVQVRIKEFREKKWIQKIYLSIMFE